MPSAAQAIPHLLSLFESQPCWTIKPLAVELQYSIPSVRRFMTKVGYYSSFTHNGAWYTLHSIPRFGRGGLWFYRDIGFSRAGSLTNTIIKLATRSPAGMTADQLTEILLCRSHSILVQIYRRGKLQREKLGRSYVYLAVEPHTAAIQRQTMEMKSSATVVQFPAEIAVLVFVEFIRNPESSFEQLAAAIERSKNVNVDASQIERLFEQHGVKKTL